LAAAAASMGMDDLDQLSGHGDTHAETHHAD
jgi:hypothetical protein